MLKIIHKEFVGYLGYRSKQDTYYYQSVNFSVAAKYTNNLKWYKVYLMIQDKKHLTAEGIDKIKKKARRVIEVNKKS
jgi:hypothetical protein